MSHYGIDPASDLPDDGEYQQWLDDGGPVHESMDDVDMEIEDERYDDSFLPNPFDLFMPEEW